jgi:hypothetical protein
MHDLNCLRKTVPEVDGVIGLDDCDQGASLLIFAEGELLSDRPNFAEQCGDGTS